MKISGALCITASFAPFLLFASDWEMELPVRQNNALTHDLSVLTDGVSVKAVFTESLLAHYGQQFSDDFRTWLKSQPAMILSDVLSDNGLSITLNTRDLELMFEPDLRILSQQTIGLKSDRPFTDYSAAASWSWQNNIVATTEYDSEFESTELGLELNSGFNIGGYRGLNGVFRGYLEHAENESNFSRGATYLFVEHPEQPYLYSIGDVDTFAKGHLSVVPIGGISLEREYPTLQPERQISNSGSQYIELIESAVVDVFINGFRTQTLRLDPGRYELDNLPLSDGDNEIRLEIRYASGESEVISYSQFYNAQLLLEGLSDYGVSAGYVSTSGERGIEYSNDALITSFYEYGVSEALTLGVNGLYSDNGYQLGATVLQGTPFGNLGLRVSYAAYDQLIDENAQVINDGYNASLDFSTLVWGSGDSRGSNLRLSLEQMEDFTATAWSQSAPFTQKGGRLNYTWTLSPTLDISYYSSHFWITDEQNDQHYESTHNLRANWRYGNWRVAIGGEYVDNESTSDDWNGFINIDYYFNLSEVRERFNLTYSSQNNKLRAEYRKLSQDQVGSLGYHLSATSMQDRIQLENSADYIANRWRGDVYATGVEKEDDVVYRAKATVATSLVFADNQVGWGRAPLGPVALIDVHSSLADSDIKINENYYGDVESISKFGSRSVVAISRAHQDNQLTYSSSNSPLGYDLGSGVATFKPGSMTAHVLTIGSDASRTVIGTLQRPDQTRIAYIRGRVIDQLDNEYSIFTNKGGRFVLEGIAPGTYQITIDGLHGEFTLKEDSENLIYLSTLILQRGQ